MRVPNNWNGLSPKLLLAVLLAGLPCLASGGEAPSLEETWSGRVEEISRGNPHPLKGEGEGGGLLGGDQKEGTVNGM